MIDYVPPGNHMDRKVNERQLHSELEAAGVTLSGVGLIKDEQGKTVSLRVHLPQAPSAATKAKIDQVLSAHVPKAEVQPVTITHARLEELRAKRRAGQALTTAEQKELLDILAGV